MRDTHKLGELCLCLLEVSCIAYVRWGGEGRGVKNLVYCVMGVARVDSNSTSSPWVCLLVTNPITFPGIYSLKVLHKCVRSTYHTWPLEPYYAHPLNWESNLNFTNP
jgi:hypothetical protein